MGKFLLSCLCLLLIGGKVFSQQLYEVRGSVLDSTRAPLIGASIRLTSPTDTLITSTDIGGNFRFLKVRSPGFNVSASLIGFQTFSQAYEVPDKSKSLFKLDPIKLRMQLNQLDEVTINGVIPIRVKEDTIEYSAQAYKVREGAPVEDVIKKLPGVTVDKDGNITAQGKQISRVRVNGKDFFGGDVQTATQNLPADIIENLQVIDDYGDQANLTGIKTGEPEKILNINIQKGKRKGYFGNATAAGGNNERYAGRAMVNSFHEERQISLLASVNNTNANIFNFNGGGGGGGARGANLGATERGGGGDGITNSQSVGFNYRDQWGAKISSYGSYSFSNRRNSTTGTSVSNDFNPMNISTTRRSSQNATNGGNHRLTWNIEYKIDTSDYIKITPNFSASSSANSGTSISELSKQQYFTRTNNNSSGNTTSPGGGGSFLYNHKFSKKGRNFSITSSIDYSSRNQNRNVHNDYLDIDSTFFPPVSTPDYQYQIIESDNTNTRTSLRASYIEPVLKSSFLEFNYAWNKSSSKNVRDVNDIDPQTGTLADNLNQSNNYHYQFITNNFGLNLRTIRPKYNFTLGIVAQPTELSGQDLGRKINTSRTNFHLIPNARFVYNFARSNTFTLTYGGSNSEPSFGQLQPIVDSTNIKRIVIGNPDLNASFTNRLAVQYNKFDLISGNSLFANLSFDQTSNRIVTNRINNKSGTGDTTKYLNTNGFYGLNGNFSYSKPFSNRKYTVTMSLSGNYDNNISFTDNLRNKGQNWGIRPGTRFRFDIENLIDADLNATYSLSKTVTYNNVSEVQSVILGLAGRNYFFKDWTLGYDFSQTLNYGYNTGNINPTLLSAYIERRFLKNNMATVRFQGFDLFNQNTGISHDINGTRVTDSQNNRLGRYFLLSFNIRLQKFSGGTRAPRERTPGGNRGDRPRGNGGGFGGGGGRRGN